MSAPHRWDPHRVDAIAHMAGAVSDDFQSLLSTILDHAARLDDELDPNDPRARRVAAIRAAAELGASLTRQLQIFGGRRTLQPASLDVNELVFRTHRALQRVVGERVVVAVRPGRELPSVRADAALIEQMLVNLAASARDAMPDGGTLAIETSAVFVDEETAAARNVSAGAYVRLAVVDSGERIDDSIRPHLFEPFYTTRPRDRATGLGLPTVYAIVAQSGGHLVVDSEAGGGARFTVFLPAMGDAAGRSASAPRPDVAETLLLVDEDASVRALIGTVLRRHGYRVLDASSDVEGAQLAETFPGAIDLVIVDERAARTPAFRDGVRMLTVRKPFRPAGLARHVRAALDRP